MVIAAQRQILLRSAGDAIALKLPLRGLVVALVLVVALLAVAVVSLATGSYGVSLAQLMKTLGGGSIDPAIDNVVWEFRFPRTIVAALVGAMMALSGTVLQTVTRNGLADPSLVGVSQGAALAVVSLTVLAPQLGPDLRPWAAFAGGVLAAGLVQALAHGPRGASPTRFILMGIGVAAFMSSITSALMTYGEIDRAMRALVWLSGSINAANWSDVVTLSLWCAVLMPLVLALSRTMSVMAMGEAAATGLGVPVPLVRRALIGLAVGFAAIATSVVGPLGFVGLIAPHAARRMARTGAGLHLILTALSGALLVSLADLIGRGAFGSVQIPAGLLTAVIGVPLFVWLMCRSRPLAANP